MLTPRVLKVEPLQDYRLYLKFKNGKEGTFDVRLYIKGSWFGELSDPTYFRQVRVTEQGIELPNEQDIAPHELYDDLVVSKGQLGA
ncbi:MAG: hypothetical protein PWP56_348 [Acetobacterium sp.]|nr:hypothetical protein [Acetobacterium sp.]